jgi:hypothetical protein
MQELPFSEGGENRPNGSPWMISAFDSLPFPADVGWKTSREDSSALRAAWTLPGEIKYSTSPVSGLSNEAAVLNTAQLFAGFPAEQVA